MRCIVHITSCIRSAAREGRQRRKEDVGLLSTSHKISIRTFLPSPRFLSMQRQLGTLDRLQIDVPYAVSD